LYFVGTSDKALFIGSTITYLFCLTFYSIFLHGKYGQTIGKRVVGIKVLSTNEKNCIGYKRALCRDSIYILMNLIGVAYLIIKTRHLNEIDLILKLHYKSFIGLVSLVWLVTELITMFSNSKRRALHDYLAGSVVVDIT
jgi:uncharacterized RDD family membrane protein YckC